MINKLLFALNFFHCIRIPRQLNFCLLSLLMLSGCQLTQTPPDYSYYGSYYLWIKSLNEKELQQEITQQQLQQQRGEQQAELNLLLLYSLPNSPIHNPYTAKAKLNKQQLNIDDSQFNIADFAFIIMLKDQLNQQLLILNKLINNEKLNFEHQKQLHLQQQSIEQLEQKSDKLQQQILQLKNIENSINAHGDN